MRTGSVEPGQEISISRELVARFTHETLDSLHGVTSFGSVVVNCESEYQGLSGDQIRDIR